MKLIVGYNGVSSVSQRFLEGKPGLEGFSRRPSAHSLKRIRRSNFEVGLARAKWATLDEEFGGWSMLAMCLALGSLVS